MHSTTYKKTIISKTVALYLKPADRGVYLSIVEHPGVTLETLTVLTNRTRQTLLENLENLEIMDLVVGSVPNQRIIGIDSDTLTAYAPEEPDAERHIDRWAEMSPDHPRHEEVVNSDALLAYYKETRSLPNKAEAPHRRRFYMVGASLPSNVGPFRKNYIDEDVKAWFEFWNAYPNWSEVRLMNLAPKRKCMQKHRLEERSLPPHKLHEVLVGIEEEVHDCLNGVESVPWRRLYIKVAQLCALKGGMVTKENVVAHHYMRYKHMNWHKVRMPNHLKFFNLMTDGFSKVELAF